MYVDFNTSHVNVNRCTPSRKGHKLISIHLMLMLITTEAETTERADSFQYISC